MSAKALKGKVTEKDHSFEIGKPYLIRTVTLYFTGCIKAVTKTDIVLSSAAWIPDTGRFYQCIKDSTINECEPFVHDCIINRGGIIDATLWSGKLPGDQK